jgi:ABC-2 type transport system ATP-binding protein
MRPRLGVARSLLGDPELLILDEPTNGLDPAGILEFRAMVRALVDEGRTVVLSSHLLDEVEKICDAVAIVDHGRVVAQGRIDEIASGADATVLVGVHDTTAALAHLRPHGAIARAGVAEEGGVRVTLHRDVQVDDAVADINRRLVEAGIAVHHLESERVSLEQRFLQITSRLGEAA